MAGIAGVASSGAMDVVAAMLDAMAHRGRGGREIAEAGGATLGAVWGDAQPDALEAPLATVQDRAPGGRLARARATASGLVLERDAVGIAPLYTGQLDGHGLAFASEVKALLAVGARAIAELPPGHAGTVDAPARAVAVAPPPPPPAEAPLAARELRRRLDSVVERATTGPEVGAWLSGGLDSSAIAALARPRVRTLHTFAAGVPGAPDLEYARAVAAHLGTTHHEIALTLEEMVRVLPEVVFHLESFDALLVRSSIANFLVGREAARHVGQALSGEGGDELFAGYAYLKALPAAALAGELADLIDRLHNTALQRVDRSAAAHGLLPHVPFLAPEVLAYARVIPVEWKLRDGVEKWILRQALKGLLPERVLARPKAKFWEGAGVGERLAAFAEERVSAADFARERALANGWILNTKEELLYHRLFRERFGDLRDLDWMGRTKGAPVA